MILQPGTDLIDHARAMHCTKICREMECPFPLWHRFIKLARHPLAVHHDQHLWFLRDFLSQVFRCTSLRTHIESHSREKSKLRFDMRTEFFHSIFSVSKEWPQCWLRGRTEDRRATIALNKRPDCGYARLEESEGYHLCFIENDKALCNIMQFSALRSPACIK